MLRVCSLGLLVALFLLGTGLIRNARLQSAEANPPADWQQRADKVRAIAQDVLAGQGEVIPLFAYIMPDGREDLEMLSFTKEAKQRAIATVTQKARDRRCRGLIMVGDSWTAPPVPGRNPRVGDALSHPQRQECLLVSLFTPDGAWAREVRYQRERKKIIFQPPSPWFNPDSPWNPWERR